MHDIVNPVGLDNNNTVFKKPGNRAWQWALSPIVLIPSFSVEMGLGARLGVT
jgi:hypothetical protein